MQQKQKYFYYSSGIYLNMHCFVYSKACWSLLEQPGVRASLESLTHWSVSMASAVAAAHDHGKEINKK